MIENRLNKLKKGSKKKNKKILDPQKTDYFIKNGIKYVDYKDIETLSKFTNRQERIVHRKRTLLTAKNQRKVSQAIKRAQQMVLLPYEMVEQETGSEKPKEKRDNNVRVNVN